MEDNNNNSSGNNNNNGNKYLFIIGGILIAAILFILASASGGGGSGGGGGVPSSGTSGASPSSGAASNPSVQPSPVVSGNAAQTSGEAMVYGPDKRQATAEETKQILDEAKVLIDRDYPEYTSVTPIISVTESGSFKTISALYEKSSTATGAGNEVYQAIIVHVDQDGEVGVAESG
jgi:hypothetical protein